MNSNKEDIPDQLFYISASNFWRLLIFSLCIITLQNLPILCLLFLLTTEIADMITNIVAFYHVKFLSNKFFSGVRIISNIFLIIFLSFYLVINIIGFPTPTGFLTSFMMSLFFFIIFFEVVYLVVTHLILIKEFIVYLIYFSKKLNKNSKSSSD